MNKKKKVLSGVLYHLTTETMNHRAYSIEEILEACDALGFHSSDVDNSRIPYVLSWLKENKEWKNFSINFLL